MTLPVVETGPRAGLPLVGAESVGGGWAPVTCRTVSRLARPKRASGSR